MVMYIIFLIILIILIIIYNILLTIRETENFTNYSTADIQFNLTSTNNEITIFRLVSYDTNNIVTIIKNIVLYGVPVYIYECVDMPLSDSIYSVFSSLVLNTNSKNSSGRSLLATTRSLSPASVPLKDNGYGAKFNFNYIFFNFPDEIKTNIFTKFEITFANYGGYNASYFSILSFNNSSSTNKISLDTLIKIPIYTTNQGVNQILTFIVNSMFTMENTNLILIISNAIKEIDIASIRIYFKSPVIETHRENIPKTPTIVKQSLRMITSNENEQFNMIDFGTFFTEDEKQQEDDDGKLYSVSGVSQSLNLLSKLRIPWGIYDASTIFQTNNPIIIEQLRGGCRNAIINGQYSIEKDNIYYIKGDINTSIEFPEGSLPPTYTICAITKYANPNTNKLEILKTANNPKIVIGHANNISGIITKNNGGSDIICTKEASAEFKSKSSTDWIVTCIKSGGINIAKTIIINNEKRGLIPLDKLMNSNKLIINSAGLDRRNCSEFGFAYLIIWDQLLSDNELVMVSNILNNYINEASKRIDIDRTIITIKDGSSRDRAAASAIDIARNFCVKTNGRYWIQPEGASDASYIFCIMDKKCKGGGWMLAMKGSQYNNTTFHYNSLHWTTNTVLIPTTRVDYDYDTNGDFEAELDAKYSIFNTFKAKECLAMFDGRQFLFKDLKNYSSYYNDFYNLKQYGWMWHETNFNNGTPITLLNFFSSKKSQFYYTCANRSNEQALINYMNTNYDSNFVKYLGYDHYYKEQPKYKKKILFDNSDEYIWTSPEDKGPCHLGIWSSQSEFYSFGFNVGPVVARDENRVYWPHRVRWGCSFNENGDSKPTTNDVSGGIGMECRNYSAGDAIGCCQSTVGINKNMSFKWFIR
jgi:hypothetical protein